jgi:hypothetical protein
MHALKTILIIVVLLWLQGNVVEPLFERFWLWLHPEDRAPLDPRHPRFEENRRTLLRLHD